MVLATHDLNLAASVCDTLVLMRTGRVLAQGPTREVLTAATIRQLYDVEADVPRARTRRSSDGRADAGATTVIELLSRRCTPRRAQPGRSIRTRLALTLLVVRHASTLATCLLAPLVGSTLDQPLARARSIDPVRRQRRRADLLRRAHAARAGGRLRRRGARVGRRRVPGAAAQSAGHAIHAGRLGRCGAGAMLVIIFGATVALGPLVAGARSPASAGAVAAAAIVYALATGPGRAMSTTVLLLAGVTLNSFFSALILFVQYLADFAEVYRAARWLMGDLDVGGFGPILAALPLILAAFVDLRACCRRR